MIANLDAVEEVERRAAPVDDRGRFQHPQRSMRVTTGRFGGVEIDKFTQGRVMRHAPYAARH